MNNIDDKKERDKNEDKYLQILFDSYCRID